MNDTYMYSILYGVLVACSWYSTTQYEALKDLDRGKWLSLVFVLPATVLAVVSWGVPGVLVGLLGVAFVYILLSITSGNAAGGNDQHIRGGQLQDARDHKFLEKMVNDIKKKNGRTPTTIGGVPIPIKDEARGILFVGMQGAGKTQGILELADCVRGRRETGILFDESGDLVTKLWKDGDLYLNPFGGSQNVGWSPMLEIKNIEDCAVMARGIVPEGATKEQEEWHNYARDLLEVMLETLFKAGAKSNKELFRFVVLAPNKKLKEMAQGTTAQVIFEEGGERMLQSVKTILVSNVKPLKYMQDSKFSIRDFVQNEEANKGKFLFLVSSAAQLKAIAPIFRAMIDLSIVYLNSLKTNENRRFWYFLDELPALGALGEYQSLLNRGRKKGGCTVTGVQSLFFFDVMYGKENRNIIMGGFGTMVAMRMPERVTGDDLAAQLGALDVLRPVDSQSDGTSGSGSSSNKSTSYQIIQDVKLVTGTELTGLPDLTGFLKRVGEGENEKPKAILKIKVLTKSRPDVFNQIERLDDEQLKRNEEEEWDAMKAKEELEIVRENAELEIKLAEQECTKATAREAREKDFLTVKEIAPLGIGLAAAAIMPDLNQSLSDIMDFQNAQFVNPIIIGQTVHQHHTVEVIEHRIESDNHLSIDHPLDGHGLNDSENDGHGSSFSGSPDLER